jgi:hypothetical protein
MRLLTIFIIIAKLSYSQDTTSIKIQVIDKSTKTPIPFVTAKSQKNNLGAFASVNGLINLDTKHFGDSVLISSVGFFDTIIPLNKLFTIIELQPDYKVLPNVNVSKLKYKGSNTLGALNTTNTFVWTSSGMGDCFVRQFTFKDSGKFFKIKTISIALTRYFEDIPITLHIRGAKNGHPSNSIITNTIAAAKANYSKKTKALVFNVENENILIDETLIFIGVEILPYEVSREKPRSIGIAMTNDEEKDFTYVKTFSTFDSGWRLTPRLFNQKKPSNIIVLITYDIYE